MDKLEVQEDLERQGRNIHLQALELAPGFGLIGLGWSPFTPFGTPSEVEDSQLGQWLNEVYAKASSFERLMLVSHTPPHGTKADRIASGAHVGSLAVREFIEKRKPEICLTGHIHEARCEDHLGPTKIVNPGMFGEGGYALISFDGARLKAGLKQVQAG